LQLIDFKLTSWFDIAIMSAITTALWRRFSLAND